MKKLILMMIISFSAMADDAYEAELKDRIASRDAHIEKVMAVYYKLDGIAKDMGEQNRKIQKRTMDYFDKIIRSCRAGDEVDIPRSDGTLYRIECKIVE